MRGSKMRKVSNVLIFVSALSIMRCESYRETDCHFSTQLTIENERASTVVAEVTHENDERTGMISQEKTIESGSAADIQMEYNWKELGSKCYCCNFLDAIVNLSAGDSIVSRDTIDFQQYNSRCESGNFPVIYDTIKVL